MSVGRIVPAGRRPGFAGRCGIPVLAIAVLVFGFAPASWAEDESSPTPSTSETVAPENPEPTAEESEPASPPATAEPDEPVAADDKAGGPGTAAENPADDTTPAGPEPGVDADDRTSGTGGGGGVEGDGAGVPIPAAGAQRPAAVPEPRSGGTAVAPTRAADLQVVIRTSGSTASDRQIAVGSATTFEVAVSGGTADQVTWWVDDSSAAAVEASGAEATVRAVTEGVTRLWVRVTSTAGDTVEASCWISTVTNVVDTPGSVVLTGARLYRSRMVESTSRGRVVADAAVTVLFVSGSWVFVEFPADYVFTENNEQVQRYAWVLTSGVDIPPMSVSVSPASVSVRQGETARLSSSFLQAYANDVALSWSSSAPGVARVSSAGVVTALAVGTATITLTGSSSHGVRVTATAAVTVTPVPVNGVSLNRASAELIVGATTTLTATVVPSNATNRTVTWSSSNPAVAAVSPTGVVTGKAAGMATITVRTADGGKTATATVKVTVPVTGVALNKTSASITVGAKEALIATVVPSNATVKTVTWSSSSPSVAEVSPTGVVTGKAAGKTTITVRTVDGGRTATVAITVVVRVTGVSVSPGSAKVPLGKTTTLKAVFAPSNATTRTVSWSSDKPAIASMDSNGLVTGRKVGTARITAKTTDGGKVGSATIDVVIPVTGVTVSPTSAKVAVKKKATIKATVKPSNATEKKVSWSSSDTKVATVSSSGVVTGKKTGTVTITATTADGGKTAKATIKVVIPVTGVSVSPTSAKVAVGKKVTIKATVKPSNATEKRVSWKSSNTKIAEVNANGVVIGKKAGTVTITAKTTDGGKTAKATVRVVVPVTGVTVTPATRTLQAGAAMTAKAAIKPSNATEKKVTWISSKPKVAKVSKTGVVTGLKPGKATITAKTVDGGKTDTLIVTVITTVTYNAMGGSGAPSAQTRTTSAALTLSSTKPVRAGHVFQGWDTKSSATKVAYKPGSQYKADKSATLYAVWARNYVALGDSFGAGTGAGDYEKKDGRFSADCYRSMNAFGHLLAKNTANRLSLETFAPCSGAVTGDIRSNAQHKGMRPQSAYVSEGTVVTTLSVGGNDADFGGTVIKCLALACKVGSSAINAINAKIDTIQSRLEGAYKDILDRDKANKSTLYVVGYPMITPMKNRSSEYPPMCGLLGKSVGPVHFKSEKDRRSISEAFTEVLIHLNSVILKAKYAVGSDAKYRGRIVYVSMATADSSFNGHQLCAADPYFNTIVVDTSDWKNYQESYHPNSKGQKAYATELSKLFAAK